MAFSTTHLAHLTPVDQALFQQYGWGGSQSVPFSCLHHAFEHHAQHQPDVLAVEDNLDPSLTITYRQLDRRANQLANYLRKQYPGVGRNGARVCLLVRRSIEMVIAILGVIKAGAAYVPLDAVTITDEQLQFVLRDSGACLVLSMRDYRYRLPPQQAALTLEDTIDGLVRGSLESSWERPGDTSSPDDGIYVIYTSGTTGQPKGVDVRHSGVTNVVCLSPGNVGMQPGYRVAQILNIAFDMCAWEVLSSLANGCTLCLRGNSSSEWTALLKTVDIIIATPSILARHHPQDYPRLKSVIVGGEVCSQSMADLWSSTLATQGGVFNNCCGPTEISIANTVQPHLVPEYPLSIGRPIPNTAVYILSEDGEALPIGDKGLMWVGGVGVSRGYLNLPERNKERWREDPFIPGGRMFNTNDLGRWRSDGQLDHLGRADDQVKVKGFRVEPDGVAAAIRTHPRVSGAVVLLIANELWGFVVPIDEEEEEEEHELDMDSVKENTAKRQPYYAVPTKWMIVDGGFPMTRNGKVDKRALKARISSPPSPPSRSPPRQQPQPQAWFLPIPSSTISRPSSPSSCSLSSASSSPHPATPPPLWALMTARTSMPSKEEATREPDEEGFVEIML